jgi:hypothetical protein
MRALPARRRRRGQIAIADFTAVLCHVRQPGTRTLHAGLDHSTPSVALAAKDLDAVMALYHEDATLESSLVCHLLGIERGIVEGRKDLRNFVRKVGMLQRDEHDR